MIIPQQLHINLTQHAARTAFTYLGRDTTFKDLVNTIGRLSYLYTNDLGQGARVAYLCRNCPAWFATFVALSNTRCISIAMNPYAPPAEIVHWLKETKATDLAVNNDLVRYAREI